MDYNGGFNYLTGNYMNTIQNSSNFFNQTLQKSPKSWIENISAGGLNIPQPISPPSNIKDISGYQNLVNQFANVGKSGDNIRKLTGQANNFLSNNFNVKLPTTGVGWGNTALSVAQVGSNLLGVKQADPSTYGTTDKILGTAATVASFVPGLGAVGLGLQGASLLNKTLGKKANKQGTYSDMNITGYTFQNSPQAGKKFTGLDRLFGSKKRKRANMMTDYIDTQNLAAANVTYGSNQDILNAQNSQSFFNEKNWSQLLNLNNPRNLRVISAKDGAKIKRIASKVKVLKKGGPMNVIPDGALHARKNNLPDDIAGDVTHKGIPVITKEEGEIKQHAEIEREEIIFHKELTNKLESLLKDYNEASTQVLKDKIAIKAGTLLTKEILFNTKDNTGLTNKIE